MGSRGTTSKESNVTTVSKTIESDKQKVVSKPKISEKINEQAVDRIRKAAYSSHFINEALPVIEKELNDAPIGTKFKVDAYYNPGEGMLHNNFEKVADNKWKITWGVTSRSGDYTEYDAFERDYKITADEVFNAYYTNR